MFVLENGDKIQGDASAATVVDYHISGLTGSTLKNLADGQLAATIGDLYTSAATDLAKTIVLTNTDSVARTINLYHTPSGGTARRILPKDMSLAAGGTILFDGENVSIIGADGAPLGGSPTITDGSLTIAKIENIATDSFLGRDTAGTGALEVLSATTARTILNVEDGADVTDATNVAAAGATMNADADVSGNTWVLDEDDLASDSATKVPTQQSVKAYTDSGTQTLSNKTIDTASNTITVAADDVASGTLAHERGGLEADVSAYNGLVKISAGVTSAVQDLNGTATTEGDLLVRGTSAIQRLGVGSDGQVLTANALASGGVEWSTAGASTVTVQASEAITAGDPVVLYDDAGTAKAKKALDYGTSFGGGPGATKMPLINSPGNSQAQYWGQCNVTTDKCVIMNSGNIPYVLTNSNGVVTSTASTQRVHTYRSTYYNLLKLEDSKILLLTHNSSAYSMSIGTVSGTTITWGVEYTQSQTNNWFAGFDVFGNGSKFVIVFNATSTSCAIKTFSWSGTTITLEDDTTFATAGYQYYAEASGVNSMHIIDSGSPYYVKYITYSNDADMTPTISSVSDGSYGNGFVCVAGEGKILKGYGSDSSLKYIDGATVTSAVSSPANKYPYQLNTAGSRKNGKNYFNRVTNNATIIRGASPHNPSTIGAYGSGTWMMKWNGQVETIDQIYDYQVFGGDTLNYSDAIDEISIFDISTDKIMIYNHDKTSYIIAGYSDAGFTQPYTTGAGSWSRHILWNPAANTTFWNNRQVGFAVLDELSMFTVMLNGSQLDWVYTKATDHTMIGVSLQTNGTLSLGGDTPLSTSGTYVARLTDGKVVVGYNVGNTSTDKYIIIDINTTTGGITEGTPATQSELYAHNVEYHRVVPCDIDNIVIMTEISPSSYANYMYVLDYSTGSVVAIDKVSNSYTINQLMGCHGSGDDEWMVSWISISDGSSQYGVGATITKKDNSVQGYAQKTYQSGVTSYPYPLFVDGRDLYWIGYVSGLSVYKLYKTSVNVATYNNASTWFTTTELGTVAVSLAKDHYNAGEGFISNQYHYSFVNSASLLDDVSNPVDNVVTGGATAMSIGNMPTSYNGLSLSNHYPNQAGGTLMRGLKGTTNFGAVNGIAQSTVSAGQDVSVAPSGTMASASGLTTGKRYYLPGNSSGTPLAADSGAKELGFAPNATNILLKQF